MTYTFYLPDEGGYIIYDTASGCVIHASKPEAYICDALGLCGDTPHFPAKCPSEIRYELAEYSSTEIEEAYSKIRALYEIGIIYKSSDKCHIKTSGEYSVDSRTLKAILAESGLSSEEVIIL